MYQFSRDVGIFLLVARAEIARGVVVVNGMQRKDGRWKARRCPRDEGDGSIMISLIRTGSHSRPMDVRTSSTNHHSRRLLMKKKKLVPQPAPGPATAAGNRSRRRDGALYP